MARSVIAASGIRWPRRCRRAIAPTRSAAAITGPARCRPPANATPTSCTALTASLPAAAHLVGHSYGAGVVLLAALQSPERVRSLTLIEPAFGSLLPEAGAGLADEKVSRSAALAKVRALVDAERHDDAAVAFIDWVQGGDGGFSRLPEFTQSGLRENARTLGPTIAGSQPDVSPASLRALRVPTLVVNGAQTRAFYRLIGE